MTLNEHNSLKTLVELVRELRAPDGCPWDREQTHESITGFLIEEAYEVVHAIKEQNPDALIDELGDLLLHVAFHAQIARESGDFTLQDVLDSIHNKVIRRHPHVFGDGASKKISDVKQKWEELKAQEPIRHKSSANSFPALVETRKLIEKSTNLGIELSDSSEVDLPQDLKEKIEAYVNEGEEATASLLFHVVDRARARGQEAEILLQEKNRRMRQSLESHSPENESK